MGLQLFSSICVIDHGPCRPFLMEWRSVGRILNRTDPAPSYSCNWYCRLSQWFYSFPILGPSNTSNAHSWQSFLPVFAPISKLQVGSSPPLPAALADASSSRARSKHCKKTIGGQRRPQLYKAPLNPWAFSQANWKPRPPFACLIATEIVSSPSGIWQKRCAAQWTPQIRCWEASSIQERERESMSALDMALVWLFTNRPNGLRAAALMAPARFRHRHQSTLISGAT